MLDYLIDYQSIDEKNINSPVFFIPLKHHPRGILDFYDMLKIAPHLYLFLPLSILVSFVCGLCPSIPFHLLPFFFSPPHYLPFINRAIP